MKNIKYHSSLFFAKNPKKKFENFPKIYEIFFKKNKNPKFQMTGSDLKGVPVAGIDFFVEIRGTISQPGLRIYY